MSSGIFTILDKNSVVMDTMDEVLEPADKLNMMEKCGEVFLDRHLGNLIYFCHLCEDRFENADEFSNHITDIHVSIESFISYEPSESDAEQNPETENEIIDETDPIGKEIPIANENEEFDDTIDYEFMIKTETDYPDEDSNGNTKEIEFFATDAIIEEDSTLLFEDEEQKPKEEPDPELENESTEPLEVNFEEEELPASKIFRDDLSDAAVSDEEILRSKLSCKFCGEQFDYVKKMRQHDCGLNKKKKRYLCAVCGKEFKKKSGLEVHSLLHKGEKPHKCDICGSAYACKQNLIVHIRRHTGEKPFKCDYCDSRFASSTEKKSHMRTHTGDRPFVCELCGKGHSSSSQLTEHMHRHLDVRNHPCETCGKRFRNSYNLKMHAMTHEKGPRLFNCEKCSASFRTNSSLLQHAKIHAKVRKYVCKVCGRAFAQHPGLYSHMKSHASVN
ncbi:zinc finger protein 3 homolog [Episyrphus balteatus]|uniref:zinc finger protein 3 homolog n=1 Tax=Episyrphus balteatus TaxID=286459 RepID=UPI0024869BA6|nr:zinc finger protein 3 homolog [Episyrphus balteatus]